MWALDAQNAGLNQVLEQRWFAGVHSNVGGGYANEGLSNIALQWLMKKAEATGLVFEAWWEKAAPVERTRNGSCRFRHSVRRALC